MPMSIKTLRRLPLKIVPTTRPSRQLSLSAVSVPSQMRRCSGRTATARVPERRARAALVQDYLTRAFGRSAEVTGTMPLGADAPESPSGDGRWDGVALTLFTNTGELERNGATSNGR